MVVDSHLTIWVVHKTTSNLKGIKKSKAVNVHKKVSKSNNLNQKVQ